MSTIELPKYTAKDFASDQEIRWCPGCGDYAILAVVRKIMPELGHRKEDYVFVSGIGCSSRFPYYMDTYGLHGIHGRAPAIATGIRAANPNLKVWLVTGDGDGLSIGGNHLLHILRRNVDVRILLFNNRIYGLTKGQYSPTSELGKKTKSTPYGSVDLPLLPLSMALGAGATFLARCTDVNRGGMNIIADVLRAAATHKGSAFVEIYQDCNVFNHQAFFYATEKETAQENTIHVQHGKPMIFGAKRDKGIRLNGSRLEVVSLADVKEDDLLFHDETNPVVAFLLTHMMQPEFPEPVGVIYRVQKPVYEEMVCEQVDKAVAKRGEGTLEKLLHEGETWDVE